MPRPVVFAALLSLASPARAEDNMKVDLSKATCAELTGLDFQDFERRTLEQADGLDPDRSPACRLGMRSAGDRARNGARSADREAATRSHSWQRASMVLRMTISLRMQATMATFGSWPAAMIPARRPTREAISLWRRSRPGSLASCIVIRDASTWSRKPCSRSTTPFEHEVVTHVSGTTCYLCVRAGHTHVGGESVRREMRETPILSGFTTRAF